MRQTIEVVTTLIWLPLELMVIAALLRGPFRRFPLILAFVVAEFLAVAAEIPSYIAYYRGLPQAAPNRTWLYLLNEVILQLLLYAIVISLIYQAASKLKSRRLFAVGIVVGALAFAGGSLAIHRSVPHETIGVWLTPWTRDLNFCSAILDLALWTLLVSARQKDSRLLLISGALGLRFTGEAIGDSIRQLALRRLSHGLSLTGALTGTLADLLCLFIWWRALAEKSPSLVPAGQARQRVKAQKEGSHGTTAAPLS